MMMITMMIDHVSQQAATMKRRKKRQWLKCVDQQQLSTVFQLLPEMHLSVDSMLVRTMLVLVASWMMMMMIMMIVATTATTSSSNNQRSLSFYSRKNLLRVCNRSVEKQHGILPVFARTSNDLLHHVYCKKLHSTSCSSNRWWTNHDRCISAASNRRNLAFVIGWYHSPRLGERHAKQCPVVLELTAVTSTNNDSYDEDDIDGHNQLDVATPFMQNSATTTTVSTSYDGQPPTQLDLLQTIIQQQQGQIDTLLKILQQQQQNPSLSASNSLVNGDYEYYNNNPLIPQLFQPLASAIDKSSNAVVESTNNINRCAIKKLKAMLFIDGTWLYYSINERLAKDAAIIQKYGRGWQHRYDIDWSKLPGILCTILQQSELQLQIEKNLTLAQEIVEVDLVRSSVYTSYKADTSTASYRYKLFQDLKKANYFVHMMETVGKSEKCVDIQLAVEILHYATMENRDHSYDIALLLTGDKDLMPAIIRTRCKGKKVGLVSMRPGCNRALVDTPGLLDFDVIWMEDLLDQLLIPRLLDGTVEDSDTTESNTSVSMYALHKVVYDFIRHSPVKQVSSRDLGRYLKQVCIGGVSGSTLLDTMKRVYGGMYQYLSSMGHYDCELPAFSPGATDYSYWISLMATNDSNLEDDERFDDADIDDSDADDNFFSGEASAVHRLSESENHFFSSYSINRLIRDQHVLYRYSREDPHDSRRNNDLSDRADTPVEKETLSVASTIQVVNDFVVHSGYERIISSDLENYLQHLRVTRSCSLLDEINRMYGSMLNFLKSTEGYFTMESGGKSSYWIQRVSQSQDYDENDPSLWSETERKFFMKYTIEPLVICRQRWYCATDSAVLDAKSLQNESGLNTPNYNNMTVAELKVTCREMGIAVSGTKALILERIKECLKIEREDYSQESMRSLDETVIPEIFKSDDSSAFDHIKDLIEEYLHAKGGVADSRTIGRYLAANKATSRGKMNALQELKAMYGNLNSFVAKNPNVFVTFKDRSNRTIGDTGNDGTGVNYGFNIALKKK